MGGPRIVSNQLWHICLLDLLLVSAAPERAHPAALDSPRSTNGLLQVNAPIADPKTQYSAGATPWAVYKSPVATRGPVALRILSPDGRRVGRTTSIRP
jgi:hypothetical protein